MWENYYPTSLSLHASFVAAGCLVLSLSLAFTASLFAKFSQKMYGYSRYSLVPEDFIQNPV